MSKNRPAVSKGISVTAGQGETQSKGIAIVLQQDRTDPKQGAISAKPVGAAPTLPRLLCIIVLLFHLCPHFQTKGLL